MSKEQVLGKHSVALTEDATGEAAKHAAGQVRSPAKIVALVAGILVGVVALVYLVGVLVFSQFFFLPGTRVNGEDVSLQAVADVAAAHTESATSYELAVTGQGLDFSVPATTIDLSVDGQAYVGDALQQINTWMWPVLAFQRRDLLVETSTRYNENKASNLITSAVDAVNKTATPPVDAEVTLDAETGLYVVSGGVPGTQLNSEAVTRVVFDALTDMEASAEITKDALVAPEVSADDEALKAEAQTLNKYAGATQTLVVNGNEVRVIDGTQISQWMVVGEDASVSIDIDAMTAWAKGELSEQLDTIGATRTYTRSDGKVVTVAGGTYGWSIDGATLASQMAANIEAGTAATIEIPMLQSAAVWNPGGVEWGSRYIDIDLSEQYVRFYDESGNLIWESSCVTGDTSQGHNTPTGVYSVNGNMASGDVELRGKIDPATNEPEYISHVTYWMPFIENAIALHDASWRSSFGGTIYQWNGSHGCVNLPTDAAARLYGMVHIGEVVVVHD